MQQKPSVSTAACRLLMHLDRRCFSNSSFTISMWPFRAAITTGVYPYLSVLALFGSALCSSSSFATSTWPFPAATYTGVVPSSVVAWFGSALYFSNTFTHSMCAPAAAALTIVNFRNVMRHQNVHVSITKSRVACYRTERALMEYADGLMGCADPPSFNGISGTPSASSR